MPLINFRNVLSCSSEDRIHCAENLLKPEQYKKWLSSKCNDERITCILEFEKSSLISSVDVGNDGSAFIELLVSRSSSSKADDWTVLLPATLLMTPNESRSNSNRNQVKLLSSTDLNQQCLNEKWDRLKIVCEQKFNRLNPFGLCFIKLYSPATSTDETSSSTGAKNTISLMLQGDDDDDETGQEQSKIGSFFAKKQAEKNLQTSESSATDQIRALSNVADELLSRKSIDNKDIQTLLKKKDVKNTPVRTSKRRMSEESESTDNTVEPKRTKVQDKSQLMKNVIFVLSGFQNPLRSELRKKAIAMGATYKDDWDRQCTHLICAFPNTPKFIEVKKTSKGFTVNKEWIFDCYKQSQLLSERNYEVKGSNKDRTPGRTSEKMHTKTKTNDDSDEEDRNKTKTQRLSKDVTKKPMQTFDDDDDDDESDEPSMTSKPVKGTSGTKNKITTFDDDVYNAETDEDEPKTEKKHDNLNNFFHEKRFYILKDDFDNDTFRSIRRIIYAYDGILEQKLTHNIHYIITNQKWNHDFEKISKTNPEAKFLAVEWLQECHNANKFVPCQSYLILPLKN